MKYTPWTAKLVNGGGGYGVSVVGPAMDFGRSHSYFMRCDSRRYMACRQWSLVRYSWSSEEYVTVYSAPRELFPGPHPSSAYMFTFAIAFDEDAQIVYWYAQTVNEYGWGSLFSLDISAFEPGKTTYRPCHVNTVATWRATSSWRFLDVTCKGDVIVSDASRISKVDLATGKLKDLVTVKDAGLGNGCTVGSWNCHLKGFAIDVVSQRIFYAWKPPPGVPTYTRNLRPGTRDNNPSTIRSMRFDGTDDRQVYGNMVYEMPTRSGGMYVSGMGIDPVARYLFVVAYKGISGKRSILQMPLPGNKLYPEIDPVTKQPGGLKPKPTPKPNPNLTLT